MAELSENALQVAQSRYFMEGENWEENCKRVATAIAKNENKDNEGIWRDKFTEMIFDLKAIPGGRILRNAGSKLNKIFNCHVLELADSIESIGRFLHMALVLNAEGGGVGCNPQLRPKGAKIKGKGGESTGVISFLKAISIVLDTVESGGSRRSGLLPILDISHPETEAFIEAKSNSDALNNFNISVGVTNEFLDAVERKKKWTFTFAGEEYGQVWAVDLFDKIVSNMLTSGEPGIVNLDKMRTNNSWYFSPIESLNLCGELSLSKNQSCSLGSLVLPSFLTPNGSTRWEELADTIQTLVRFLDNTLDVNNYSFPEMYEATQSCRRIGIGCMGLGDYLFSKKVRYGSSAGLDKTEELVKFMRNEIYKASIELAKEKGPFPGFSEWPYTKAKFIKKLPARIRMDIKKYGIRQTTSMAFAPAGTISLIANTTSGIEPLPMKAYIRKDRVGERVYIHPTYKELLLNKEEIPNYFVDAFDLSPENHFETTVSIQRLNDSSISKTQLLPKGTKHEQLKEWILEYARDLVGITVYVDGSRKDQILNRLTKDEALKYINKQTEDSLTVEDVQCARGTCEL